MDYSNTYEQEKTEIYKLIPTAHINEEETHQVLRLCHKYYDIFYKENDPLTFNNKIP